MSRGISHGVLPREVAEGARTGMTPIARRLATLGVSANAVTAVGLAITLVGAALLATDRLVPALAVLVVGTLADALDGALARASGGGTKLGAFLDSTFDRIADGAIGAAIASLGALRGDGVLLWAGLVGLVSSFLVSYVRAKAESLGSSAAVGFAPREARLVLLLTGLGLSLVLAQAAIFVAATVVVAALATITLIQRVAHAARSLGSHEGTFR